MDTTKDSKRGDKARKKHKRTISEELHKQWRKLERKNDSGLIAEVLNVSKPTIDKALIYGCVHQQAIVDGINKYFGDRLIGEKEAADHLKSLSLKDQPLTETPIS